MLKRIINKSKHFALSFLNDGITSYFLLWRRRINNRYRKSKDPLRWGIIGTGNMATVFANALNKSRENIVAAVLSRSEDKAYNFARIFDIRSTYHTIDHFLADKEIDVVYVATPLSSHFEYCRKALEAGKNILCEKPLTPTLEEAKTLFELARRKGSLLMEGLWSSLLPTYIQAHKWIKEGKIGGMKIIRVEKSRKKNYSSPEKYKSVLWDYGIYALSFVNEFLSDPEIVDVSRRDIVEGIDVDWHIELKSDNAKAYIDISGLYPGASKAYIIGEKGVIEFSGHFNRTNKVALYTREGKLIEKREYNYISEGFEYEINEIYRLIRQNSQFGPISPESTQKVLYLLEKLSEYTK